MSTTFNSKENGSLKRVPTAKSGESLVRLQTKLGDVDVKLLDECFFVAKSEKLVQAHQDQRPSAIMKGTLYSDLESDIPVMFRIVGTHEDLARCNFHLLPEEELGDIRSLIRKLVPLQQSSVSDSESVQEAQSDYRFGARLISGLKYLAVAAFFLLTSIYLLSKIDHTITAENGVVEGKRFVVQSPDKGNITTLLVNVGDSVQAGDVLARVSHMAEPVQLETVADRLAAAKSQLDDLSKKEQTAVRKVQEEKDRIAEEIAATEARIKRLDSEFGEAKRLLDKLAPLIAEQNIAQVEVDAINERISKSQSDLKAARKSLSELRLSQEQLNKNVLVDANGKPTAIAAIRNRIAQTRKKIGEFQREFNATAEPFEQTEIVSPQSGTVHAVHVQPGHGLDSAQDAFELNVGETWVSGHVSDENDGSIEIGQPAKINVPKKGVVLFGTIQRVGKSNENGIPIDVKLDPMNAPVPAGEKVDISIRTGSKLQNIMRGLFGNS